MLKIHFIFTEQRLWRFY